ncbi:hypothetical protein [Kribbella ginsengisoli]|uniref:XRE family transcriptional regulator n=1 Tax=Kribbella ginsengisoli TaxID=363865 RepID=A0ABP6Z6X4_9ACTN
MTAQARQPNQLLRAARAGLSQVALAEQVNTEIYRATGRVAAISSKSISDWERGWYTWPSKDARAALRSIFGKTDIELGFFKQRVGRAKNRPRQILSPYFPLEDLMGAQVGTVQPLQFPAGKSFTGVEVVAHHCAAKRAGRDWLVVDPANDVVESLRRPDARSVVVAVDDERRFYVCDGRHFADHADHLAGPHPLPAANVIDDLTIGIIWAVINTDTALLADDGQLEAYRARLAPYDERLRSEARLREVPNLNAVSRRWLGSQFCVRHVARHLDRLTGPALLWSRERSGEEAASWLIWSHRYEYLHRISRRFTGIRHGFCVPESEVAGSPRYERVLLLLATALMEAFGVRVEVSAEPDLGQVEGFVLAEEVIVADSFGDLGLWYVDVGASRSRTAKYRQLSRELAADAVNRQSTAAARLMALAEYLDVPWQWFQARCEELAVAGVDNLAHPRSRLLSTRGLNTAIRYVAYLETLGDADSELCGSGAAGGYCS